MERRLEKIESLYFVVLLSMVVKIIVLYLAKDISSDSVLYLKAAESFARGDFNEGMRLYPMPFYSIIISGLQFIFGDFILPARLISVFSLTLASVPLYFLTKELWGASVAFWGTLAFSVSSTFNSYSVEILRDPPFLFFVILSLFWAVRGIRYKNPHDFFYVSLSTVFACLFRIEGVLLPFFFLSIFLFYILFDSKNRRFFWDSTFRFLCLPGILIFVLLIVSGENFINYNRFHEILLKLNEISSFDFLNNYHLVYQKLKVFSQELPFWWLRNSFGEVARHYLWLIYFIGLIDVFFVVLSPVNSMLVFASFFADYEKNSHRNIVFGLFFIFLLNCYVFYIEMNFIVQRYVFVPSLLLFPLVGLGFNHFYDKVSKLKFNFFLKTILIMLFIFVPLGKSIDDAYGQDDLMKISGEWLKSQSSLNGNRTVSNDARILFYAGHNSDYVGFEDLKNGYPDGIVPPKDVDLFIYKIPNKQIDSFGGVLDFTLIKKIEGKMNTVLFYRR